MSMLRNVLTYMGLGPDEDYDDGYPYDPPDDDDPEERRRSRREERERVSSRAEPTIDLRDGKEPLRDAPARKPSPPPPPPLAASRSSQRRTSGARRRVVDEEPLSRQRSRRSRHDLIDPNPSRPLRAVPPAGLGDGGDGVTIRSVPPPPASEPAAPVYAKPRPLSPRSFGDAKILADEFKSAVPVIMNLQGIERDLARRLIDFASGVCYALDGSMEKIASQVFLLTPKQVEVSEEDRRRLEERGYER